MTTTPVLASSGGSTQSTINNSLASLASNSQTFLTLLTTQLKNQDPTSPLDTNQFTAQLTQMTGVEQQLLSNQLLQQLVSQNSGSSVTNAAGLIGKDITASGDTATLNNGAATWQYTLGGTAANVAVQISDSSGNVVYSGAAPTGSGAQTFTWNGKDSTGAQQANGGLYTVSFNATDASGGAVPLTNSVQGKATAVEMVNGQIMVTINGVQVPQSAITTVDGA
jgi:flagellar basal-body rod modification protein FlgD